MSYVPTVYILDGSSYCPNKKISFMIDLGSCLILSPGMVIWHFQQRTINHFVTERMRSIIFAYCEHSIWEFILRKGIISYKLQKQEHCSTNIWFQFSFHFLAMALAGQRPCILCPILKRN